mmetsp:Transcript_59596/g.126680  ORF Transcript_59596/g.126680 Transcript_59596/m.126680 type:complete len:239 (+) Transcript_59596:254-970(+)
MSFFFIQYTPWHAATSGKTAANSSSSSTLATQQSSDFFATVRSTNAITSAVMASYPPPTPLPAIAEYARSSRSLCTIPCMFSRSSIRSRSSLSLLFLPSPLPTPERLRNFASSDLSEKLPRTNTAQDESASVSTSSGTLSGRNLDRSTRYGTMAPLPVWRRMASLEASSAAARSVAPTAGTGAGAVTASPSTSISSASSLSALPSFAAASIVDGAHSDRFSTNCASPPVRATCATESR